MATITSHGEKIRDAIAPHRKDGTYVPTITNLDHINSNNSSGFRGVNYRANKGKYRAYIRFQRRIYHLGYYDSLEDVVTVRKAAENRFFGDYQTD